jgi:hypothetical protein
MVDPLKQGIVRILRAGNRETAGTGFVVRQPGDQSGTLIITCSHVVDLAGRDADGNVLFEFHIVAEQGRLAAGRQSEDRVVNKKPLPQAPAVDPDPQLDWPFRAKVVASRNASAQDVTVLRYHGAPPSLVRGLPVDVREPPLHHRVETYGFPSGKSVSGVDASAEVGRSTTEELFPTRSLSNTQITHGFSGAPVFDPTLNAVIGMVVSVLAVEESDKPDVPAQWLHLPTAFYVPTSTINEIAGLLPPVKKCPYRGLLFFEESDSGDCYGREDDCRQLIGMLNTNQIVAVVGVSGSGKSSFIRAGFKKRIDELRDPNLITRLRCTFVASSAPLMELMRGLEKSCGVSQDKIIQALGCAATGIEEEYYLTSIWRGRTFAGKPRRGDPR